MEQVSGFSCQLSAIIKFQDTEPNKDSIIAWNENPLKGSFPEHFSEQQLENCT